MNPGKAFRTLLLYRIGATLSYQITMVAVGWHLYEITNSVVSLGLIGLAELVPYFALALYSGHAVVITILASGLLQLPASFILP